jgi:hypothetical protein
MFAQPKPAELGLTETVLKEGGEGTKKIKYGAEISWDIRDTPPQLDGRFVFYHTCLADLSYKQLYATEGNKEFGPGFYTTCADIETPAKVIAKHWFESGQTRHDWHIIAFSLKTENLLAFLLENAGDQKDKLSVALRFYLSHSTGYPSKKKEPDDDDLADINAINLLGRVLILPSNKDKEVSYFDGKKKSWTQYTAGKCGGGPYYLIIGPQQPENMLDYRQYAWTTGWGIYLINNAMRFYQCRNYQIFGKDAGKYRAPLKDIQWPGNHAKTKPDGSKF